MTEIVRIQDSYYILAASPKADAGTRVLKHDETFAVFDRMGDVTPGVGLGENGVFHEGTRHVSRLELHVAGKRPMLLSSTVEADNSLLAIDLTNPDVVGEDGGVEIPRSTLHVLRTAFLYAGSCYSRISIDNHGTAPVDIELSIDFDADFADIFEVRGLRRARRGERLEPLVERDVVVLGYRGLDGRERATRFRFRPAPRLLEQGRALFGIRLGPRETTNVFLTISCEPGRPTRVMFFSEAAATLRRDVSARAAGRARLRSSNENFNDWLDRSLADLAMMETRVAHGTYPYAGVPWFSAPFGRDGIITALECLEFAPAIARGVLGFLAETQAKELDPARDAEPGKILHEMRGGEMAALGEVPFGRYYGSVDATPLFLVLAGAYLRRTADIEFVASIRPQIEAALEWIEHYGDRDGDGFVEYVRSSPNGLTTQGWKDSWDSVFHEDGSLAEGPIALCEVQAYVYGALHAAARILEREGERQRTLQLREQAFRLQRRFDEAFWIDELQTYALALDGRKRPCRVRTSNAGHVLLTGLARPDRARATIRTLRQPASHSGWGIRTVAEGEARYNPMSYHNGSIWPHDNALIAEGMARYGTKRAAVEVFTGLFEASRHFELQRMPELFCGFARRPRQGPTRYPLACAPQSWSAGAVLLLLRACLGLSVDAERHEVRFVRPTLPSWLDRVRLDGIELPGAVVDLECEGHGADVIIKVLRREGDVEIVIRK